MKTILIADEDTKTRNLIRLLFTEDKGYRVVGASNGPDAISKAEETAPDVALVDFYLSNQNGHKVSKEIKNNPSLKNTSVILFTSAFLAPDEEKVLKAHADDLIVKPFELEDITRKVESVISEREKREVQPNSPLQTEEISRNEDAASSPKTSYEQYRKYKRPSYSESSEFVFRLFAGNLENFRAVLKGHVQYLRGKLKEKDIPAKALTKARSLTGNLRASYGAPLAFSDRFKSKIKRLREKSLALGMPTKATRSFKIQRPLIKSPSLKPIITKARSFRVPSLNLSRGRSLFALASLVAALLVTSFIVFADVKEVNIFSLFDPSKSNDNSSQAESNSVLKISPPSYYEAPKETPKEKILFAKNENVFREAAKTFQPKKGEGLGEFRKTGVKVEESPSVKGEKVALKIDKGKRVAKRPELAELPKLAQPKGTEKEKIASEESRQEVIEDVKRDKVIGGIQEEVREKEITTKPRRDKSGTQYASASSQDRKKVLEDLEEETTKSNARIRTRIILRERIPDEEEPKYELSYEDIRRKYMQGYNKDLEKTRLEQGNPDRGILGPE